jgi:hypothetical protein
MGGSGTCAVATAFVCGGHTQQTGSMCVGGHQLTSLLVLGAELDLPTTRNHGHQLTSLLVVAAAAAAAAAAVGWGGGSQGFASQGIASGCANAQGTSSPSDCGSAKAGPAFAPSLIRYTDVDPRQGRRQ